MTKESDVQMLRDLTVERWPIDRLLPYAKNARTHSEKQIAQVAASIVEFGWTNPILVGPDGVLINVGRGPLVNERALFDALRNGDVRAAAIDVWYRYPAGPGATTAPATLPFGELANVLMTPHSSGVTTDTFIGRTDDIAANIGRLARGETLRNVIGR